MEFLRQVPPIELVEHASKHTSFVAELFEPRPGWDAIVAYRETMLKLQASIEELAARGRCPFAQLGIYMDHQGAWLLVTAKKEMQLCHARSGLSTLLQPLDLYEEGQATLRKRMEKTVRPFDALDKVRLDAWKTMAQLRPVFPKAPKPESEELPPEGCSLKQFLESVTDSEDEDIGPPTLAIADGVVEPPCPEAGLCEADLALYQEGYAHAYAKWSDDVQHSAVVVMLAVGEVKGLTYIPCHREERRVQFLVARLHDLPDLAETVALAVQLAQEGLLPVPTGARARKKEFLERCQAALKQKNPLAELDVQRLPAQDQRLIALALQPGKHLCSKCPNAADVSLEFSLSFIHGVPEPEGHTVWFCKSCAPARAALCPGCGKHDTLIQEGGGMHSCAMSLMLRGHHEFSSLRCKSCKRAAVAPLNNEDRRKLRRIQLQWSRSGLLNMQ